VLLCARQTSTALLSTTMVQLTTMVQATVISTVMAKSRALLPMAETVMRALAFTLLFLQHLHLQAKQIGQSSSLDPLAMATTVIKRMYAMRTRL